MPNAKVLESKKAIVDALTEKLQNSTSAVFVDYKGITVAQDTELRHKFREAGVEYTVVKNTLTRFAANKAGYNQFDELLNGTTSMACMSYSYVHSPPSGCSQNRGSGRDCLRRTLSTPECGCGHAAGHPPEPAAAGFSGCAHDRG